MPRVLLLLVLPVAGCADPRPKAPPLANDAVYQNDKIGLRFLVPEGWLVASRADLPPGPLTKPLVLAGYQNPRGERPADLEVLAADLPADADPGTFAAGHRVGPDKWAPTGPGVPVAVNGA